MMEGFGAGSVLVTNGSEYGSRRPKNIRILRLRIRNTGVLCTVTDSYLHGFNYCCESRMLCHWYWSRIMIFLSRISDPITKNLQLWNWVAGLWIRIPIGSGFNRVSGSWSRRAKMTHKHRKNLRNFTFRKFEVLDVQFWELKASFVTWTSFKEA